LKQQSNIIKFKVAWTSSVCRVRVVDSSRCIKNWMKVNRNAWYLMIFKGSWISQEDVVSSMTHLYKVRSGSTALLMSCLRSRRNLIITNSCQVFQRFRKTRLSRSHRYQLFGHPRPTTEQRRYLYNWQKMALLVMSIRRLWPTCHFVPEAAAINVTSNAKK
jgi:hypothetical protein